MEGDHIVISDFRRENKVVYEKNPERTAFKRRDDFEIVLRLLETKNTAQFLGYLRFCCGDIELHYKTEHAFVGCHFGCFLNSILFRSCTWPSIMEKQNRFGLSGTDNQVVLFRPGESLQVPDIFADHYENALGLATK